MGEIRHTILLVDDDPVSLDLGKNILEERYRLYMMTSGKKMFDLLKKITPDLILLDIEMPVMNGYEVIKQLKDDPNTADIPVIFLTAYHDRGSELEGLNLGAIDYITKPFSAPILLKRIENHLLISSQKKKLQRYNINLQEMVDAQTREIKNLQNGILSIVAEVVEFRNDMSGGHVERITNYMRVMVNAILQKGIYKNETMDWDVETIIPATQLHDVGKICIGENILNKPGRLSTDEFEEIKKHPAYGVMMIGKMEQAIGKHIFLLYAGAIAETHHERWDGTGYPAGLKGVNIPILGRIMALIDTYDAIISARPYKQPVSPSDAVEEIIRGKGTVFDPLLVDVFAENASQFAQIAERHDTLI